MKEHGGGEPERGDGVSVAVRMAKVHGAAQDQTGAHEQERTQAPEQVKVPVVEGQTKPREREFTWENFEARAEDIALELEKHAGSADPEEGFKSVLKEYVQREDEPRLVKFSKLMVLVPRILEQKEIQDNLREKRRQKSRHAVDGPSNRHVGLELEEQQRLRKATRTLCAYNQIMTSLADDAEDALPPAKLRQWLGEAAGGDDEWALGLVLGVQAERVAEKLVASVPGLEGVMHGDLDQDLEGQDIIFEETPAGFTCLDVKRRAHKGVMPVEVNDETRKVTLYIDPAHIDRKGYRVLPRFEQGYRDALAKVLVKGERLVPDEE
jgi:hypothetical protein